MKLIKRSTFAVTIIMILCLAGCGGKSKPSKNWYEQTIQNYKTGFSQNWSSGKDPFNNYVCDSYLDKNITYGYIVMDLNKDGIDELLIGIVDEDATKTVITDIIANKKDIGVYNLYNVGDYGELYILSDGRIRHDDRMTKGQVDTKYFEFTEDCTFLSVDGGGEPMILNLTPFERGN